MWLIGLDLKDIDHIAVAHNTGTKLPNPLVEQAVRIAHGDSLGTGEDRVFHEIQRGARGAGLVLEVDQHGVVRRRGPVEILVGVGLEFFPAGRLALAVAEP